MVKRLLGGLVSIILLIGVFLGFTDSMQGPPGNLKVLVDHEYKTIISPECMNPNINYDVPEFAIVEFDIARNDLDYEYDSICTEKSLFPTRNNLINFIGTNFGILKPMDWKWNEDGTWKEL